MPNTFVFIERCTVIAYEGNGVLRSGNVFLSNDNESLINESIFCSASDVEMMF